MHLYKPFQKEICISIADSVWRSFDLPKSILESTPVSTRVLRQLIGQNSAPTTLRRALSSGMSANIAEDNLRADYGDQMR